MPTKRIINTRKKAPTQEEIFAAAEKANESGSWLGFKRACVEAGDIKSLEVGIRALNAKLEP